MAPRRQGATGEREAEDARGCCVPGECLRPREPVRIEDAVRVLCNNDTCAAGRYMHRECFEQWEGGVLAYLKSCGRARSWSERQRHQNLWTKKGYDLAFKACGCRCGRGHLKKDLDWAPPGAAIRAEEEKKRRRRTRSGRTPAAAPDGRSRAFSLSSSGSCSPPSAPSEPSTSPTHAPPHAVTPAKKISKPEIISDRIRYNKKPVKCEFDFRSEGSVLRHHNNLSWYKRCRASHNWCNGYYKAKVVLHHYSNYMPWIDFHNSEALLVSVGSQLHCYPTNKKGLPFGRKPAWKLDVPKINRHDIRTNDISRFVVKHDFIVCGNRDGCVTIYRINNIQSRPRIECHIRDCHENGESEVSAVDVIDNRGQLVIVSASSDASELCLCSWRPDEDSDIVTVPDDQDSKNVVNIYHGHVGAKCIALNKAQDKLAIGLNGNSKPLLLDVNNTQFLMTAEDTKNPKQAIRDIQWHDENSIVYVTHSGFLQMIDVRSHNVIYNMRDPFQSTLYCVKSDGEHGIVVGSAEYSRCVLFDSRNDNNHVQMYFTQRNTSPVYSLDFDSTKLITAVDRGVGVSNFNVDPSTEPQRDYSHIFYQ